MTTAADRPNPIGPGSSALAQSTARPTGGPHEEELAVVRNPGPRQLLFTWPHCELRRNDDPFTLRHLAWCGLCSVPMAPSWRPGRDRAYRCTPGCQRQQIPAGDLEAAVADAVRAQVAEFGDLSPLVRASALEHLLDRVVVGADLGALELRWDTDSSPLRTLTGAVRA